MSDACRAHYMQLLGQCNDVLQASFQNGHASQMARSHAFLDDMALWINVLRDRSEAPILTASHREYQFAMLALVLGQYRAAFSALRLSLESCFGAIQWSTNERELREWMLGRRDSSWSALVDKENGILSKGFVALFSDALADEAGEYRATAAKVYRECSEYVHGNAHTHRGLPEHIAFDENAFDSWQQKASSVRLSIAFALAARYLQDLNKAERARLESMLLDHLGHSTGVRILLGAPVEVASE